MHYNNLHFTSILFLALCGMLTITGAFADELTAEYIPGELIVWFDTQAELSTQAMEQIYTTAHAKVGADQIKTLSVLGHPNIQLVQIPTGYSVEQAAQAYLSIGGVKYAEPNYIVKVQKRPNDPRYAELWGMDVIDATVAWEYTTGSKEIIVAVVDTGVDCNHPDLAANMWRNPGEIPNNGIDDDGNGFIDDYYGWNFANNNADPMDGHGHGTHVAGTIGAVGNNGIGVAGVNWNVSIMAVKGLNDDGRGSTFDLISAVIYASKMGADIINNSWGGPGAPSRALEEAIRMSPALIVFAAGNYMSNLDIHPESTTIDAPNVILVAASNIHDDPAWYTNYGKKTVHVVAPGGETSDEKDPNGILSTTPNNNYAFYEGTSMAAPHVSGLAALIKAANPSLTASEIKNIIMDTATPVPQWSERTITGGIINAANAIAKGTPPVLITPEDGVGYVWSEDKTLLRITESGSYAFSDTEFGNFGMYIDAPQVNLNGRTWPSAEQVMISGHRWVIDGENVLIGIHGDMGDMATLHLEHVTIALYGLTEDSSVSGITAAQHIFDSSISIRGASGNIITGVGTLHGFFKSSKISILASDESVSTGIGYVYGTIAGGDITISTPRLAQDFIITGIGYVAETGVISGSFITLTGIGSGVAHAVSTLMGTVTGGLFTVHSDEVYGVEEMVGGTIASGDFNLHGYSYVNGIGEMHSNAVLSGGTFEISSNYQAAAIGISRGESAVLGGTYSIFGKEAVGILRLNESSVMQGGNFKVEGTDLAVGLHILAGTSFIGDDIAFSVTALNPGGFATAIFVCDDGVISGGEFHARSNGNAFALVENQCTIIDGIFWAISPSGGVAVGINETKALPAGGEFNAWAQIHEDAMGIVSPKLSNGKEIENYFFDYNRAAFMGAATEYSVRSAMIREIYDTDTFPFQTTRLDMEALIIPDMSIANSEKASKNPYAISLSHLYDLESMIKKIEVLATP